MKKKAATVKDFEGSSGSLFVQERNFPQMQ